MSLPSEQLRLGFIGLGNLGRPLAANLLAETATLEVCAGSLPARRVPEVALVERGRLLEQCEQTLALPPLAVLLR